LSEWRGTLTCDDYAGYDVVFRREGCIEAGCLAHARRKFDELAKANASPVAAQAIARIARLYKVESQAREMTPEQRLAHRQQYAKPLWDELHAWMALERTRVPDGGGIAAALDYSLKRWGALGRFLDDGAVSVGSVTDLRNRATDVRRIGARNRWVNGRPEGVTGRGILQAFAAPA
ncbi:MAG TPA: transposase, partial [Polyangiales bacterium]